MNLSDTSIGWLAPRALTTGVSHSLNKLGSNRPPGEKTMRLRRGILASTPIVFAVAIVAFSACGGGSSSPDKTAATPTFSPRAGAVNAGQKVTISTTTANATIFYTVDGTQPKTSVTGTTKKYTAPIGITAATTIKA